MKPYLKVSSSPEYEDTSMTEARFEAFSIQLDRSQKALTKLKQTFMEAYGLSAAHTRCLTALKKYGALTQNQLADLLEIDRSQVSRVLKDMYAHEFVTFSDEQPYNKKYTLSKKGLESATTLENTILLVNSAISKDIPQSDIEVFYRTFNAISSSLLEATKTFSTPESMLNLGKTES